MEITFKAWQTFTEYNQSDLAGIFSYPATTWEFFTPLVLFSLCMIVTLATFFSQERLKGKGDIFSSFAVASWFTAIIATIMTMIDMVDTTTLLITYGISIASIVLLYLTRDR